MQNILLVDGYNMIGAWPELQKKKQKSLEEARDLLIDKMAEYQARTGYRVIIVFDAYYVHGTETQMKQSKVEVIFTRKKQTADEKIEQLARELKRINVQIHVATSDSIEQWVIFGQGALRKSARELLGEVQEIEADISVDVKKVEEKKPLNRSFIQDDILEKLEKIRRRK